MSVKDQSHVSITMPWECYHRHCPYASKLIAHLEAESNRVKGLVEADGEGVALLLNCEPKELPASLVDAVCI
jgi:hypothetical protein